MDTAITNGVRPGPHSSMRFPVPVMQIDALNFVGGDGGQLVGFFPPYVEVLVCSRFQLHLGFQLTLQSHRNFALSLSLSLSIYRYGKSAR